MQFIIDNIDELQDWKSISCNLNITMRDPIIRPFSPGEMDEVRNECTALCIVVIIYIFILMLYLIYGCKF
jgi:hypothetical protein